MLVVNFQLTETGSMILLYEDGSMVECEIETDYSTDQSVEQTMKLNVIRKIKLP